MLNAGSICAASFALLLAACGHYANGDYRRLFGDPAPPTAAVRTILIQPQTRHVNVEGGEVVRFVVGAREFSWHFNVARTVHSFDLAQVAPAGVLNRPIIAYIAPDPKYMTAPP